MSEVVYNFKIIGSDGKTTRSGVFSGDNLNIDSRKEERMLYIYNDNGDIYSKTLLEYDNSVKLENNPLSFIQEENTLIIINNLFKDGYNTVCYHPKNDQDKITKINCNSKISSILSLEDNQYIFYVENDNQKSSEVSIQYFNNSFSEELESAYSFLSEPNTNSKYIKRVLSNLTERNSLLDELFNLYYKYNNNNIALTEEVYKLLNIEIYLINAIQKRINKLNILINSYPQEYIEYPCKYIMIYEFRNNKRRIVKKIYNNDTSNVLYFNLEKNKLYMIDVYDKNDNFLCSLFHVSYPENIRKTLWEEASILRKSEDNMNYLVDSYLLENQDFDYESIKYLISSIEKEPPINLLNIPEVYYENSKIICEIQDDLINHLDCFLVIKNYDLFYSKDREVRQKINNNIFSINLNNNFFYPEDIYCIWIEDSSGNLISNIYYFSVEQHEYIEEVNNKVSNSILNKYKINLLKTFDSNNYLYTSIKNALFSIIEENLNKKYLCYTLLSNLCISDFMPYYDTIVNNIIEYYLSNNIVEKDFFSLPVKYDMTSKELIYPLLNNKYILEIIRINLGGEISYDYQTVEYDNNYAHVNINSDFIIVFALNPDNYRRSGYVYINNLYNKNYFNFWNIDLEVEHGF